MAPAAVRRLVQTMRRAPTEAKQLPEAKLLPEVMQLPEAKLLPEAMQLPEVMLLPEAMQLPAAMLLLPRRVPRR